VGRRIVVVVLVVLAVVALVSAISAGFYHASYVVGAAGGHVMPVGPGYVGYGGGWGFFPGSLLFPIILLLIVAAVLARPWHHRSWRYGYGPRAWGRGSYGPGPSGGPDRWAGPDTTGPGAWSGPGPGDPGAWSDPGPGGPGARSGPATHGGYGTTGPDTGDLDAGPNVHGAYAPNTDARDAGLWSWLTAPRQVFDEWHRQAHAGPADAAHRGAGMHPGAWVPPAGPPVPPEAATAVTPESAAPVEPEAAAPVEPETAAPAEPGTAAPVEAESDAPITPEPKAMAPEAGAPTAPDDAESTAPTGDGESTT